MNDEQDWSVWSFLDRDLLLSLSLDLPLCLTFFFPWSLFLSLDFDLAEDGDDGMVWLDPEELLEK